MTDIDYEKIARELAREPRTIAELFEKYGLVYCGRAILLDLTAAQFFGVSTGHLVRSVERNLYRFPPDFCWRSTPNQFRDLICQFGISNAGSGGSRHPPYVFTKEGVAMLAMILKNPIATDLSIQIARWAGRSERLWGRVALKTEIRPPRL